MKNYLKKIKKEKGAVSLLVIVTVLTFVLILLGAYMLITSLRKSQEQSDIRIQEVYGEDVNRVDEIYEEIITEKFNTLSNDNTIVEYIKSTGTQYIDTGVNPADTIDFEIEFKTDEKHLSVTATEALQNGKGNSLFGSQNYTLNRTATFNLGANKENSMYLWKNNTYVNGARIISFSTDTYNPTNKMKIENKANVWKVNGTTIDTADSVGTWKDTTQTLILFGYNRDGTIYPFNDNLYIYSCKIWNNSTLIRNYIPYVKNNKPGLFDLVNEVFYTNAGTGEFVIPQ